jgi:hypothetical protein
MYTLPLPSLKFVCGQLQHLSTSCPYFFHNVRQRGCMVDMEAGVSSLAERRSW